MDIEIIDNFMPKSVFGEFQNIFNEIPWYLIPVLQNPTCDPIHNFMFGHTFYVQHRPKSELFSKYIEPLLSHMQVHSLIRVKANLTTRTEKIIKHGFHTDYIWNEEVKGNDNCFAAILYINTNNGYTEFKDGTKIESIENRLIKFPIYYEHTGTTCTDEPVRVNINFNYF